MTVVVENREPYFGDVVNGEMQLNVFGQLVVNAWEWLGRHYSYVTLDEYVVLPNHLHGIIIMADDLGRGDSRIARTGAAQISRKPLGRLIGAFKTVATKKINLACGSPGNRLWQRNYYEHIIRDDEELDHAREYIRDNPMKWDLDIENPDVVSR